MAGDAAMTVFAFCGLCASACGCGSSGEASANASDATLCAEWPEPTETETEAGDEWPCGKYACVCVCERNEPPVACEAGGGCTTVAGTGTSARPEAASCEESAAAAAALVGTDIIWAYALGERPMAVALCCFCCICICCR